MTIHAEDRAAIDDLRKEHVRGVNEQDVELVLRDYAEDLVYLSPGLHPIVSKEALRAFITPVYESTEFQISMVPEHVEVWSHAAFEWGHVRGTARTKAEGQEVPISQRYALTYRRREDESWEIRCASMNEGIPTS